MKKTAIATGITTDEEFNAYVAELIEAGFTIISPETPSTWIHFAKDNKIGYVQIGNLTGFDFSSVHKPSPGAGSGYGVTKTGTPTIQDAIDTLNMIRPNWERGQVNIKKYGSVDEFLAKLWCKYVITTKEIDE